MPEGTWRDRFDELEDRVGEGVLTGQLIVNQRYAAYQHVHKHLNHPRGGGPDYVSNPLRGNAADYVDHLADHVLDGRLVDAMADNMEDLSDEVTVLAPVDRNILRQSGHPTVRDGAVTAYDRPPKARRIHT